MVDIQRKQWGKPSYSSMNFYELLDPLWPQGKAISRPKLDDIKSILHLIPCGAKNSYDTLMTDVEIVDDIIGLNGIIDFEEDISDNWKSWIFCKTKKFCILFILNCVCGIKLILLNKMYYVTYMVVITLLITSKFVKNVLHDSVYVPGY